LNGSELPTLSGQGLVEADSLVPIDGVEVLQVKPASLEDPLEVLGVS
jgi:hypothetical protein